MPVSQGLRASAAVGLEIHVHLHSYRQRIRLREIDENFDHVDVGHVALPARADASRLDDGRDEGDLTREFASAKCVITCRDSGGPAELVRDDETGLVCEPSSQSIAIAMARLIDNRALAERLGARAGAVAATMQWNAAVKTLMIV